MTETDTRKVAFGLLLLAVSTVLVFGPGTLGAGVPVVAIAAGTLGLAAGALLVGTSDPGRPV
ncbi:hypothetical protein [Halosimplex salinum]|uniref:hypothetical protein n=1 Tax=Halosimplex salinum TaxID=1710538 RepID=UPI000F4A7E4B|nr:hypothetical protein [Halosimplex salinum]